MLKCWSITSTLFRKMCKSLNYCYWITAFVAHWNILFHFIFKCFSWFISLCTFIIIYLKEVFHLSDMLMFENSTRLSTSPFRQRALLLEEAGSAACRLRRQNACTELVIFVLRNGPKCADMKNAALIHWMLKKTSSVRSFLSPFTQEALVLPLWITVLCSWWKMACMTFSIKKTKQRNNIPFEKTFVDHCLNQIWNGKECVTQFIEYIDNHNLV